MLIPEGMWVSQERQRKSEKEREEAEDSLQRSLCALVHDETRRE
jgi:hypothetical protein